MTLITDLFYITVSITSRNQHTFVVRHVRWTVIGSVICQIISRITSKQRNANTIKNRCLSRTICRRKENNKFSKIDTSFCKNIFNVIRICMTYLFIYFQYLFITPMCIYYSQILLKCRTRKVVQIIDEYTALLPTTNWALLTL